MGMFEKAVRMKLRFEYRGILSVEDLWDLDVKTLDRIFKKLNAELKNEKEESLLEVKTEKNTILELKVEIIKYIVNVKIEERNAMLNAMKKKQKKEKLMAIIKDKEDKNLYDMDVEKLKKMVDEL